MTGTEERLATGDAVNVAARLEQAADPGEVLIGAPTLALVREAVVVEAVEPLALKGKAEPLPAFRLLAVPGPPERSHASRFVGRARELATVRDAWGRALSQAQCELVTVVGEAGVGKSRLVEEALDGIEARVVRGRCPPYGEGITYWPVVEVVKQLDALPSDEEAAAAVRSLLGESERPTSADEIAWAFRKLLEEQAPLVVCFDDLQWGEETFLDLIESLRLFSAGAPLLLLCMARPELLERRPSWPVPLRLEPLQAEEADALIGDSLPEELGAADRREGWRKPALHHRDAGAGDGRRRARGAADADGAPRRPTRPGRRRRTARCSSGERSRARCSTAAPCRPSRRRSRKCCRSSRRSSGTS